MLIVSHCWHWSTWWHTSTIPLLPEAGRTEWPVQKKLEKVGLGQLGFWKMVEIHFEIIWNTWGFLDPWTTRYPIVHNCFPRYSRSKSQCWRQVIWMWRFLGFWHRAGFWEAPIAPKKQGHNERSSKIKYPRRLMASILPWVCICKDVKRMKQRWATRLWNPGPRIVTSCRQAIGWSVPLRDLEELRSGGSGDMLFLARLAYELHQSEENFGKIHICDFCGRWKRFTFKISRFGASVWITRKGQVFSGIETVDSSTDAQLRGRPWMSSDVQVGTWWLKRQTWNRHNSLQSQEQSFGCRCGSSLLYLLGYVQKTKSFVKSKNPRATACERGQFKMNATLPWRCFGDWQRLGSGRV